jgi:hypothetical protein
MFNVVTKGRTAKISGLPIIRVPRGKVCLVRNFHLINYNDNDTTEVVKHGEISFVPVSEYYNNRGSDYPLLDIARCKFECK